MNRDQRGFTITELVLAIVVFSIISVGVYSLLTSYITSATFAQMKALAVGVATAEMEELRTLPYNSLAVQGGAILIDGEYLPAEKEIKRSDRVFTVSTDIRYVDDAYDGCFSYGSEEQMKLNCRNGPPDSSKPVDTGPHDYKVAQVNVKDKVSGQVFASLSSNFAPRVAEVPSDIAMLSVKVTHENGEGIPGATVRVRNNTVTPAIDQTVTTDDTGTALFSDIKPDNERDYIITASKTGYSTLETIPVDGEFMPRYPNLAAVAQNLTNATMKIDQVSSRSLSLKVVSTSGTPLSGTQISIKGGIKLYTNTDDDRYSYNETLTTDTGGMIRRDRY